MLTDFHRKIWREVTFCESFIYLLAEIKLISKKQGGWGSGFVWLRTSTVAGQWTRWWNFRELLRAGCSWLAEELVPCAECLPHGLRSFVDSVAFFCQHLTHCNTLRPHIKLFFRHFFRCQCDLSRSVGRKDPQFLAATWHCPFKETESPHYCAV
jgi:hypothetical protein